MPGFHRKNAGMCFHFLERYRTPSADMSIPCRQKGIRNIQKSGGERHFFGSILCHNFISTGLRHSALHIAAAQATGANIHPLHSPIYHHVDPLHIRCPSGVSLAVGMADRIAVEQTFATYLTKLTHGLTPPWWSQDTSKRKDHITMSGIRQAHFSACNAAGRFSRLGVCQPSAWVVHGTRHI